MSNIHIKSIHNTALLFILFAPFTVLFYAFYVYNPVHAGSIPLYILLLIADTIGIAIVGTLWLTILLDLLQPEHNKRDIKHDNAWLAKHKPQVDVLIPVANEPLEIIEKTVLSATRIQYPHYVFILDDGNSPEVQELARRLYVNYIARPHHAKGHAKSGNLNYGLQFSKSEFFAVFDADHVPEPEFLDEVLPFFVDPQVALVQTPQHYVNTDKFIAQGTAQAQEIFYKFIQPAKNSYNAAFCVGTNVIFRRSAIDEIGGIKLIDHSEDIWTSIHLHEKGYHTVFYNKILAKGRAPETISSFFRQQNRWARGGFSLFFTNNPLFSSGLSLDQKMQYFFSNIHYFTGIAILIYLLLPIGFLLFGLHPMNFTHSSSWLIHYAPYFFTVLFIPLFLLGKLKLSTISISIASFYPYIAALGSVVLRSDYKWISTESKRSSFNIVMFQIWPHVFILALSLLSIVVAWYNPIDFAVTFITSCWVLVNSFLLYEFIKQAFKARG